MMFTHHIPRPLVLPSPWTCHSDSQHWFVCCIYAACGLCFEQIPHRCHRWSYQRPHVHFVKIFWTLWVPFTLNLWVVRECEDVLSIVSDRMQEDKNFVHSIGFPPKSVSLITEAQSYLVHAGLSMPRFDYIMMPSQCLIRDLPNKA